MGQIVEDMENVLGAREAAKDAKNERQKILAEMQRTNAEKTNLIKKALAAQKAKFGAGGGGGMSKDAVLKRLESETAEPYEEKLRAAKDKMSKIKTPKSNLLKLFLNRVESFIQ